MKPNGLALLIVLCMVLTGVAAAEGAQETAFPRWSNGLSAAQPYKELPEVDLTQKLGYMMFHPANGGTADVGQRTLEIFLPRTDLSLGSGMIHLIDKADGSTVAEYSVTDGEYVKLISTIETDLEWLQWETGMTLVVMMDHSLPIDHEYYVTLDEGIIQAEAYGISNPEMVTERGWSFSTASDYGVEQVETGEDGNIVVHVRLGGEAVAAYPYLIEGSDLTTDVNELTESGTITITGAQEDLKWGISFVDASGNVVAMYEY